MTTGWMTTGWMTIRVQLVCGGDSDMRYPPGRLMLVGPQHTFRQLADAINLAFARWDLGHLHEFELADGRLLGIPDDEGWDDNGRTYLDDTAYTVVETVAKSAGFDYVFDLGDFWLHRCIIERHDADPGDAYGPPAGPALPVPIWGWGDIPDQYGRRWDGDTGDNDLDEDQDDDAACIR